MSEPLNGLGNLPIRPPSTPVGPAGPGAPRPAEGGEAVPRSFADYLKDSIQEVNQLQNEAEAAVHRLATGQDENVTEVMNAVQKADLAFQLFNQIRNKLIAAYQELKNMRL
jgi:flagellar hook-basal body complex protein FliE